MSLLPLKDLWSFLNLPTGEHVNSPQSAHHRDTSSHSWFYFISGDRTPEMVERWADEIATGDLEHGGGNNRLAIDRCNFEGIRALEKRGVEIFQRGRR
jgi:hypothetical protein